MPIERQIVVHGVRVPTFLYGTAWKEDATERLTRLALEQGFRGIDTANQRRHYHEAGVGAALRQALERGAVSREALFLQTKFTHRDGQDHRLPYDPEAPTALQVRQSLESSLEHLGVEQLDSLLLHGPTARWGLGPEDVATWTAMEELQREGRTRLVGISNVTPPQLEELCALATVPIAFVQNRCFAATGWDRRTREICATQGIRYQGFSLLTANRHVLGEPGFQEIMARTGHSPAQLIFRFALWAGMICLTGTSSAQHMREDLEVYDLDLPEEDLERIESIAG